MGWILRILLGVAAAVLSGVLLLDRRGVPEAAWDRTGAAVAVAPPVLAVAPKPMPSPAPREASPSAAPSTGEASGSLAVPGRPIETAARRPAGHGIYGRLEFDGGLPPGLAVRISPDPRDHSRGPELWRPVEPVIAADGTFDVSLPDGGAALVEVTWQGGSALFQGNIHGNERLALLIRLGTARLDGRVLDAAGRPIAGASVRDEFRGERFAIVGGRTVTTDATGAWALDHLPASRHSLQMSRPAGADLEGDVRWETVLLASGEHRTLDLGVVATDAIWTGFIRRRDAGSLTGPGHLFLTVGNTHLRTPYDGQGRFRIAAPPGPYQVVIEPRSPRRGFVLDLPPELRPPTTPPLDLDAIVLRDHVSADVILVGGAVSGRLLAEGRPDDGTTQVAFRPISSGSSEPAALVDPFLEPLDAGLHFQAVALPPGRYLLAGFVRGDLFDLVGPHGRPAVVDVVDGGEITGLELRIAKP